MIRFRDIKPENVLIQGGKDVDPLSFNIRLIDFGSAIDQFSMQNYYGEQGPSDNEQTRDYAPPEALFEKSKQHLNPPREGMFIDWFTTQSWHHTITRTTCGVLVSCGWSIFLEPPISLNCQDAPGHSLKKI